MNARVAEVVEQLQGQCTLSLADVATEAECNDIAFCREVDDQIFECEACGWWCEISDLAEVDSDEQYCQDCQSE